MQLRTLAQYQILLLVRKRGKMIKFRGNRGFERESIESPQLEIEIHEKSEERINMGQDFYFDLFDYEINVSGHWLKVEDLEAIVEKVMGGKNDC